MADIRTTFKLTDNVTPTLNKIQESFSKIKATIVTVNQALSLFNKAVRFVKKVGNEVESLTSDYFAQVEQETKLYTALRQRIQATEEGVKSTEELSNTLNSLGTYNLDIDTTGLDNMATSIQTVESYTSDFESTISNIKNLANTLQNVGIYEDKLLLTGAQELATFVKQSGSIEALLPTLANITAQQYGYDVTESNMRSMATTMGKLLMGQVDGLSKLSSMFTSAQREILKTGTEEERVATIVSVLNSNVGNMNETLAKTPQGQIANMKNQITDFREEIGKCTTNLELLYYKIKLAFSKTIASAMQYVSQHAETFSYIIVGLATSLATYVMVVTLQAIPALIKLAAAFALAHATALIIVGAILALISVFALFGNTSAEVCGRLAVIFVALGVTIKNVFVGIFNILWDSLVFIYDLALVVVNTVIALINGIIIAINWIGKLTGLVDKNGGIKEIEYVQLKEYRGLNEGLTNYEEALPKTYQAGSNLGDSITDLFTVPEFDVNIDAKTASDGSLIVTDKNLIDIADDYRELLSRRAVERFNLQMSNVTPSITIDHVDVHKEADANNVLNTVVNALDEVVNSSLIVKPVTI